jgi:hypothetical protein
MYVERASEAQYFRLRKSVMARGIAGVKFGCIQQLLDVPTANTFLRKLQGSPNSTIITKLLQLDPRHRVLTR